MNTILNKTNLFPVRIQNDNKSVHPDVASYLDFAGIPTFYNPNKNRKLSNVSFKNIDVKDSQI